MFENLKSANYFVIHKANAINQNIKQLLKTVYIV